MGGGGGGEILDKMSSKGQNKEIGIGKQAGCQEPFQDQIERLGRRRLGFGLVEYVW